MAGDADASAAVDPWADFAERRRSSAAAPPGSRPLLDLFPPAEEECPVDDEQPFEPTDPETASSAGSRATLAAGFLLLMAAGASAAAYIFREELAAILAAWQQTP